MKSFIQCIEEIPMRLREVLDSQPKQFDLLNTQLRKDNYKKIVIVASGTSYNAAFTAKIFGEKMLKLDIELMYPNYFVNYSNHEMISNDYLYVFISQTGTTKLVLEAVKIVNEKGADTISITEKLSTPIAEESRIQLEMGSVDEAFIYRTVGYSTSVLTISHIFMALAKRNKTINDKQIVEFNQDIQKVIANLPQIKKETLNWFERNKDFLHQKEHFIFSGAGSLGPVATEADIKFMEMLPVLSNSFELEEIIHGPQNMFLDNQCIFLLAKDKMDEERIKGISSFIQNEIGDASVVVSNQEMDTHSLKITSNSRWMYPLEYITVFQILAYELSKLNNRDLSIGIYPQVTKYVKKTV